MKASDPTWKCSPLHTHVSLTQISTTLIQVLLGITFRKSVVQRHYLQAETLKGLLNRYNTEGFFLPEENITTVRTFVTDGNLSRYDDSAMGWMSGVRFPTGQNFSRRHSAKTSYCNVLSGTSVCSRSIW